VVDVEGEIVASADTIQRVGNTHEITTNPQEILNIPLRMWSENGIEQIGYLADDAVSIPYLVNYDVKANPRSINWQALAVYQNEALKKIYTFCEHVAARDEVGHDLWNFLWGDETGRTRKITHAQDDSERKTRGRRRME
jgi:hypothetical protein